MFDKAEDIFFWHQLHVCWCKITKARKMGESNSPAHEWFSSGLIVCLHASALTGRNFHFRSRVLSFSLLYPPYPGDCWTISMSGNAQRRKSVPFKQPFSQILCSLADFSSTNSILSLWCRAGVCVHVCVLGVGVGWGSEAPACLLASPLFVQGCLSCVKCQERWEQYTVATPTH